MQKQKQHDWVERVEWEPENGEAAMDEIVVRNADMVHIERVDDGVYWMAIYKGDERQIVTFSTARGAKIFGRTEPD
jgi:hypothetical protein